MLSPSPPGGTQPPTVLIGAVTAYVLEQQRRREEEEARQAAAAAAFNANQRAMDAAYDAQIAAAVAAKRAADALSAEQAAAAIEQADMTEAERLAAYQATDRYQQSLARMDAWYRQQAAMDAASLVDLTEQERWAARRQAMLEEDIQRVRDAHRRAEAAQPEPQGQPRSGWQDVHGVISSLPNIADCINGIREITLNVRANRLINYEQIGNQLIIRGPRSARQTLGLNPYTNRVSVENSRRLLAQTPSSRAFNSVASWWTFSGVLLNAAIDYYFYYAGEYDQQEFGAALLFDTSVTIISAAVGGFIGGAIAGAIAGAPMLGIGAIPAAAIGGIIGALAGVGTSLVLNYFVREWYINTVSDGWDWLGQ